MFYEYSVVLPFEIVWTDKTSSQTPENQISFQPQSVRFVLSLLFY